MESFVCLLGKVLGSGKKQMETGRQFENFSILVRNFRSLLQGHNPKTYWRVLR